jgi:hypothetical protein
MSDGEALSIVSPWAWAIRYRPSLICLSYTPDFPSLEVLRLRSGLTGQYDSAV